MANYIGIGFVFSEDKISLFDKGLNLLLKKIKIENNEFLVSRAKSPDNFIVDKFKYDKKYYTLYLSLEIKKNLKGILIEIDSNEILKGYRRRKWYKKRIANIMIDICKDIECSYAVCDSEVELEYTYKELKELEELKYSICVSNSKGEWRYKFARWQIDGLE